MLVRFQTNLYMLQILSCDNIKNFKSNKNDNIKLKLFYFYTFINSLL